MEYQNASAGSIKTLRPLKYLQAEHLNANDSLVHVLKNKKRRVFKKELEEKYPCSKDFLFEFSENHPEILKTYKRRIIEKALDGVTDIGIENKQKKSKEIDTMILIEELNKIKAGRNDASEYHNCIKGILSVIFCPYLWNYKMENEINEGRKRIDITASNRAKEGFFKRLNENYRVICPMIYFECKNYMHDLKNPEYDQIAMRLNRRRGMFGLIICRKIEKYDESVRRCKDILNSDGKYIITIEDKNIIDMILFKNKSADSKIDEILEEKLIEIIS